MKALLIGAGLALAGCTTAAVGPQAPALVQDEAADRAAILAQSKRFSAAYVAGDVDTIMAIYDDGYGAPGGADFLKGEALRNYWAPREGRRTLSHSATPEVLKIDGDMAMDWGYYQGVSGKIGEEQAFKGKYVIVWERDADGIWRIAMDMWNSLPRTSN